MSARLEADSLCVLRGDRCLFRDVGFALAAGELLLLTGRNGSGKTSLMRTILGLLDPENGSVRWDGEDVRRTRQAFHGQLAWVSHRSGLKSDLTPAENLALDAVLRPRSNSDLTHAFERLDISRLRQLPVRALSAGQQRRVSLARLLLADVPLWLLDEPFTNLDADGRVLVQDIVSDHLRRGGLCVAAAHQPLQVEATVHGIEL